MVDKSKRVVVISASNTTLSKQEGPRVKSKPGSRADFKNITIMPALRFLKDGSLIEFEDGSVRQIYEVEGANLIDYLEKGDAWEQEFKALVDELKCDVQLIATSRPYSIGAADAYCEAVGTSDDAYRNWHADYIYRWFKRVAEVTYLPSLRFFFVLTMKSCSAEKKFAAAARPFLSGLKAMGHVPRLLKRSEVRGLLMHYFVAPPADSSVHLPAEPPEALMPSTMVLPEMQQRSSVLQIGDLVHRAGRVIQFPAKTSLRWMIGLIAQAIPYTVAVHIAPCNQTEARKQIRTPRFDLAAHPELESVLDGRAKAVDVSISFATYGQTEGEASSRYEELSNFFVKYGATAGDATQGQAEAWRATLPLGIKAATQRVSSEVAMSCWPAAKVVPAQKVGLPLGFAWSSREPYFLDAHPEGNTLVVGSDSDRIALTTLISSRYFGVGAQILHVGVSDSAEFLQTLYGADLSEIATIGAEPGNKQFTLVRYKSKKLGAKDLTACEQIVANWANSGRQLLVIEDAGIFVKSDIGLAALKKILARCGKNRTPIYLGVKPEELALAASFWKQFDSQFIMAPQSKDRATLKKILRLSDKVVFDGCDSSSCLAVKGTSRSVIRLVWSPMDVGVLLRSSKIASQTAEIEAGYKASRQRFYDECRAKNPKLTSTDAWRQAVYYFGLQVKD